jgi:hypothetical protein
VVYVFLCSALDARLVPVDGRRPFSRYASARRFRYLSLTGGAPRLPLKHTGESAVPYSLLPGSGNLPGETSLPAGRSFAGYSIGILCIDAWYPYLPGNVVNASTYNFPVLIKTLKGVSVEQIVRGDPKILNLVCEAGTELIEQGVRAIAGACGSFANFQKQAAAAFKIPTFMSSMLQVPLILQSLRPDQKLGVIAFSHGALTQKVFDQCEIDDPSRLLITDAKDLSQFQRLGACEGSLDLQLMERELVGRVRDFVARHPEIGALLLQCSDMPPFAAAIQNEVHLPVFDMITLINWIHDAVVRRPYRGFI